MSRRLLRDVALTPPGWQETHSPASPAPEHDPSPYMSSAEAAVFTRRVREDGTPNKQAFFRWAARKGLRSKSGLWSRAELRMAIESLGAFGLRGRGRHAASVANRRGRVSGTVEAKSDAKNSSPDTLAAQFRLTLRRAGHTDACIDAMTLEEADAQAQDHARAEAWCAAHDCRIRYRSLQFPTLVPSSGARP